MNTNSGTRVTHKTKSLQLELFNECRLKIIPGSFKQAVFTWWCIIYNVEKYLVEESILEILALTTSSRVKQGPIGRYLHWSDPFFTSQINDGQKVPWNDFIQLDWTVRLTYTQMQLELPKGKSIRPWRGNGMRSQRWKICIPKPESWRIPRVFLPVSTSPIPTLSLEYIYTFQQ